MWSLWLYSHDWKDVSKCFFFSSLNFLPIFQIDRYHQGSKYLVFTNQWAFPFLINFFFQLLFPLHFTNMIGKVDIVANVQGGGFTGKSGAIRYGIANGLTSFVDEDVVERMRIGEFKLLYFIIVDRCRCRCSLTVRIYLDRCVSHSSQYRINCDLIPKKKFVSFNLRHWQMKNE